MTEELIGRPYGSPKISGRERLFNNTELLGISLTKSCGVVVLVGNGKSAFPDEDAAVATLWLWAFNKDTGVVMNASPVWERFVE